MRARIHVFVLSISLLASVCQADCPTADLTGDCFVDLEDLAVMSTWWMSECLDPNGCPDPNACDGADLVVSCQVDAADLLALAGRWLTGSGIPDEMVLLPGGAFQMGDSFEEGDSSELPVHVVTVSPFYISRYEITNGQYCDFLNSALGQGLITVTDGWVYKAGSGRRYLYCDTHATDSYSQIDYSGGVFSAQTKGDRNMADDPMVMVTWYGAVAYCNWRSQQEGRRPCYNLSTWVCGLSKNGYHLPTEAQWEYAARGGLSRKRFPWGNTISHSQANYYSSGLCSYDISPTEGFHPTWNDGIRPYTSPVGSFAPNGYGLYDMTGNVWEWCNDWYLRSYYSSSPQTDPTGSTSGTDRVLRGAAWRYGAQQCRMTFRGCDPPDSRCYEFGFRVSMGFD